VRDYLINRSTVDYDFVVDGDAILLARQFADRMDGDYFDLDKVRGIGRVILEDASGLRRTFDFARMRGSDIDSDLKARDFTINALAMNLENPKRILDPTGGMKDLKGKVLRVCSSSSIEDDPVRALRAVRLATELELQIEPDTILQVGEAASTLAQVSPERIRDELFRILDALRPVSALRMLDRLDLLRVVFPDLADLESLELSASQSSTSIEFALSTVDRLGDLLSVLAPDNEQQIISDSMLTKVASNLDRVRDDLNTHLNVALTYGRKVRQLLFFAALYHYAGKSTAKLVFENDQILDDDIGDCIADMVEARAVALRLSNAEVMRLRKIVTFHVCPNGLEHFLPIAPRSIYRFFQKAGNAGVEATLLSLANEMVIDSHSGNQEKWKACLEVAQSLLEAYFLARAELIDPPPLVRGGDLTQNLGVEPGSEIGRLLEIIREAQAVGEVSTPAEALDLAREIIKSSLYDNRIRKD
jgi:poly(A) polymerase